MNCSTLSFFHACFLTYIHKLYIRWALLGYANTNTVKDISLYAHIFFSLLKCIKGSIHGRATYSKRLSFFFFYL